MIAIQRDSYTPIQRDLMYQYYILSISPTGLFAALTSILIPLSVGRARKGAGS